MKVSYYPGCTLKTTAKGLEKSAIASLASLGIVVNELPSWNCCGAVYSLADDDLIHHLAPVRILIRVRELGNDKVFTLCSMCYNVLARVNLLMRNDEEKRMAINLFMDEEPDYHGEVEVVHFLKFLNDEVDWKKLREDIKIPLYGLKVSPYYGCMLHRPREVAIEALGSFELMTSLLKLLGATVIDFPSADRCCGSYQIIGSPEAAESATSAILESARNVRTEALALTCPLCEFNLQKTQEQMFQKKKIRAVIPTFYITQLLAIALGLGPEICHFEMNGTGCIELLKSKGIVKI
ncbi:CoB--CoM heterodisulfide reductase iron-sulfur subunit B family protein [Thermodesulfobacteriota bacterium]